MVQDRGMLSTAQRELVTRSRIGHLATADARGAPHVVPVCFAVSDDTLYITIDRKPKGNPRTLKRLRNLLENPAAAFVVDRWDEDWTRLAWVMLRGPAEILDGGSKPCYAPATRNTNRWRSPICR
jgi:PPOX class probable F420-dependent enzyme